MRIRQADIRDRDRVRSLYLLAFSEAERDVVADLAGNLFGEETTPETFAIVAEVDDKIVGHVSFSPVVCTVNHNFLGYLLAPLAVHPEFQKQGIGTQLIESGIQHLSSLSVDILFVYGDPGFYGRFGFDAEIAGKYTPPYELQYDFGWQAKRLTGRDSFASAGELTCVHSFMDPQLW